MLHRIHFACGHLQRCWAWLPMGDPTLTSGVVVPAPDRTFEQTTETKSGLAIATSTHRHDTDPPDLRDGLSPNVSPLPLMLCTSPPAWASVWKGGLICAQLIAGHQELALNLFLRFRLEAVHCLAWRNQSCGMLKLNYFQVIVTATKKNLDLKDLFFHLFILKTWRIKWTYGYSAIIKHLLICQ